MSELPNDTLAKQEMIDFHHSSDLIIGRPYGARVAHIAIFDACTYLCGYVHDEYERLYFYTRGDRTCQKCLREYRKRWR